VNTSGRPEHDGRRNGPGQRLVRCSCAAPARSSRSSAPVNSAAGASRRRGGLVCEPAPVRLVQVPPAHHAGRLFTIFEPDVRAHDLRATGSLVVRLIERELRAEDLAGDAPRSHPRRPGADRQDRGPQRARMHRRHGLPVRAHHRHEPRAPTPISVRSTRRCAGTSTAPADTADPSNLSATESSPNRARSPQLAATLLRLRLLAPHRPTVGVAASPAARTCGGLFRLPPGAPGTPSPKSLVHVHRRLRCGVDCSVAVSWWV